MKLKILFYFISCQFLIGCASVATTSRPVTERFVDTTEVNSTLVRADTSPLSEERIDKLMDYRYKAPALMRVALMPLGGASSLGQSDKLLYVSDDFIEQVVDELKKSSRVYDVSFLPSFLINGASSQSELRLAAATYQADLLLLYSYQCRTFGRYKVFSKKKQNSYCSVEAAALDTRSGTVPFTAVSVNEFSLSQENDESRYELRLSAEANAITQGMAEIMDLLSAHIQGT